MNRESEIKFEQNAQHTKYDRIYMYNLIYIHDVLAPINSNK